MLLAGSGLIPFNTVTSWSQFTGAAVEMIMLSFALGARMSDISQQREAALHAHGEQSLDELC